MVDSPREELCATLDGAERRYPLDRDLFRIGRGVDNDIVLSDFSVSRNHARLVRESGTWVLVDQGSTNGIRVNGVEARRATVKPGDRLGIGTIELRLESRGPSTPEPRLRESLQDQLANASIVRPLAEFTAEYGIVSDTTGATAVAAPPGLDPARAVQIVGSLTRLAGLLMSAESVDEVLERMIGLVFDSLPVERGFVLLGGEVGEVRCELARVGGNLERHPSGQVPVSRTIVEAVMTRRVALLTHDALSDHRLSGGESIRIHGIRSAMCVPLWSGEKIVGVFQVDSPLQIGTFEQADLDFVTAVANYAAVAVERIRNAQRVIREQELRSRLERYHSPAVVEEVMRGETEDPLAQLQPREVTVLFADLVGFTALAERLPPNEVALLLRGFFNGAAEAVFAAGGTLDKFIGDCVMAFFGAPIRQSDHARRAVGAAVEMLSFLDRENAGRRRQGLPTLECRVAINSGPVVVGNLGSDQRVDYTVLGNTVNVAARLEETVAGPGQLVIGPETRRLLAGAFPTEGLGSFQLKGLQQPIEAFRVLR